MDLNSDLWQRTYALFSTPQQNCDVMEQLGNRIRIQYFKKLQKITSFVWKVSVWPCCNCPPVTQQRLNSGNLLGTGRCEWLWSIATWANGCLPSCFGVRKKIFSINLYYQTLYM